MFLCLGLGFLAASATAALYAFGAASDEPPPAARIGSFVFLGLAVLTLGSSLLARRWERAVRDQTRRRPAHAPHATGRPEPTGTAPPHACGFSPGPVG